MYVYFVIRPSSNRLTVYLIKISYIQVVVTDTAEYILELDVLSMYNISTA